MTGRNKVSSVKDQQKVLTGSKSVSPQDIGPTGVKVKRAKHLTVNKFCVVLATHYSQTASIMATLVNKN